MKKVKPKAASVEVWCPRALSRVFPTTSIEADTLRNIAIFCGAGLLVSLCVASYGLDLSAGLF